MLGKFALKINNCTLNVEKNMKLGKKRTKGFKMMSMSNQLQKADIFL